jgi:tetratricopeptide (TPR) repeat protein
MTPLLSVAFATFALAGQGTAKPELKLDGLGPHRRAVTTSSAKAQAFFNQGLNLMFAFNHEEAFRSFETASKADPNCAMAYWGMAMAQGPEINRTIITPEQKALAEQSILKAGQVMAKLSPVEHALIYAAKQRYLGTEDRHRLDQKYAGTMWTVWKKFGNDPDVGALYAESLMDLQPWDLWTKDGEPKGKTLMITQTLEKTLKLQANHPLALHLTIHAWEASKSPEVALPAANRLLTLQPGLGHNVHMPSHTYVRTGKWKEAIISNQRAIQADRAFAAKRPTIGFYQLYMAHNGHMLGFSATMTGQSALAIGAMDQTFGQLPEGVVKAQASTLDGYMAMPLEVRVRFGKWDEIIAYPLFKDYLPIARTLQHAARGVAYAAKGEVSKAQKEQSLFNEWMQRIPEGATSGGNPASKIMAIAQPLLAGEILLAQDKTRDAIGELQKAVAAEDDLTYMEPPDWIISTRHVLGVALLDAGRPQEAEKVYRDDLANWPNNGWALYGLSEALRMQDIGESAKIREQFTLVWKDADMSITSSCMCIPSPRGN